MWFVAGLTPCSITCGTGIRQEIIKCIDRTQGKIVHSGFCNQDLKPDSKNLTCSSAPCLPR